MAELPTRRALETGRALLSRRVMVIAATLVAVAGVAGGVAVASAGGSNASPASSGDSSGTAAVVRTDIISTVQDGGSIGYAGSYTIAAPSGNAASTITAQQQAVAADRQALSADEQSEADAWAAGNQAVSAAEASVSSASAILSADQATESRDCAKDGASSAACSQDKQKVAQDQAALIQARGQLGAAQSAAKANDDQAQGKVGADRVKLTGDQATLASLQAVAMNPGTAYTWLPAVGQVITQDQRVYAVSGVPVPLLYGSVPAYRAFYVGMPDGADVGELTRDLIRLGYGDGVTRSDHYSQATAAAVERWQRALGLPATGQILLGEVVFEPGPIRVTSVTASPGASYGGGGGGGGGPAAGGGSAGGDTVLTATGISPVVTVDLGVDQEYLVKPGDAVSVVLPDGSTTVPGRVQTVGSVATCSGGGGIGTGGGGTSSPCSSAGSNGGAGSDSAPTVTVTISLDRAPPGAALDQAPVNVNFTTQRADNVLAVPVTALLALQGGGYAVQVVTGRGSHLVAVTTGLYSDTMVQVSGPGIRTGERVEVPSS